MINTGGKNIELSPIHSLESPSATHAPKHITMTSDRGLSSTSSLRHPGIASLKHGMAEDTLFKSAEQPWSAESSHQHRITPEEDDKGLDLTRNEDNKTYNMLPKKPQIPAILVKKFDN